MEFMSFSFGSKGKECTHTKRFFVVLCVRHMFNQLRHTSRPFRRIQLTVVTTTSTLSYNLREKKKGPGNFSQMDFGFPVSRTQTTHKGGEKVLKKRHKKLFYLLLIVESLRTFDIGKLLFNSSNPKRSSHAKATSEKVSSVIRLCS